MRIVPRLYFFLDLQHDRKRPDAIACCRFVNTIAFLPYTLSLASPTWVKMDGRLYVWVADGNDRAWHYADDFLSIPETPCLSRKMLRF